jgi:PIN domain nuclease of toxin-antitoxin system
MRLLIDSHALIWYVDQHQQLSATSHAAMSDPANELLLSAGSIWEIAIKIGLGKLVLTQPYLPWMSQAAQRSQHHRTANHHRICRCASESPKTSQ